MYINMFGIRKESMNRKGFTFVELVIVFAIIALLCAIVASNLQRARQQHMQRNNMGTNYVTHVDSN